MAKRKNKNGVLVGRMNRIKWAMDAGKYVTAEDKLFLGMAQAAIEKAKKPKPKKVSTKFYSSKAWLDLRYRVLKHYGAKCMCCAAATGQMQVDHIKPRSRYPELALSFDNMQVLCASCNMGKLAWDETDYRPKIAAA